MTRDFQGCIIKTLSVCFQTYWSRSVCYTQYAYFGSSAMVIMLLRDQQFKIICIPMWWLIILRFTCWTLDFETYNLLNLKIGWFLIWKVFSLILESKCDPLTYKLMLRSFLRGKSHPHLCHGVVNIYFETGDLNITTDSESLTWARAYRMCTCSLIW